MTVGTAVDMTGDISGDDAAAIRTVVQDLYATYLDGDRVRLEAHIDASCTLWDSAVRELRTKADLQAARRDTPPQGPQPVDLVASGWQIRVWGDTAVESHELEAVFAGDTPRQYLRCTSVMRRIEGDWMFVHHHEEVLSGSAIPAGPPAA